MTTDDNCRRQTADDDKRQRAKQYWPIRLASNKCCNRCFLQRLLHTCGRPTIK